MVNKVVTFEKKCSNCGADNDEKAKFCSTCATSLEGTIENEK
jgi:hypothetical protein